MNRDFNVSVCLASFNGEDYIKEQIISIVRQLNVNDELIISDDGSTDSTLDIIQKLKYQYPIIRCLKGPQKGFALNFCNAIIHAKGDIIIFSDQDDIWYDSKVDEIYKCFIQNEKCTTVLHDMTTFREHHYFGSSEIKIKYYSGILMNFIKSSYWGCCMAVKRTFLEKFIPFRDYCVGHDQLIGLMSEKFGHTTFLNKELIAHRLHNRNTSNKRTIIQMIAFRIELYKDFSHAIRRYNSIHRGT